MSQQHPTEYYRTTSSRVGKMLAIMLGICIVGGVIFFAFWDYWISEPPHVLSVMAGDVDHSGPAEATGITITQDLQFLESADFRSLTFNAMIDEPGVNPTIEMSVGDRVVFNVVNDGMSFHAFGVVSNPDDFNSVIFDSAIAAATNPLKPGESGSTTFIAGAPGNYHYICTVPGHALQGMIGEFIVE